MSEGVVTGFDPASGTDATALMVFDPQTGMSTIVGWIRDLNLDLGLDLQRYQLEYVTQSMVAARRGAVEFELALSEFGRKMARYLSGMLRSRRSGHRHRGTRDWRLRHAPARRDLPLGERTLAKARAR